MTINKKNSDPALLFYGTNWFTSTASMSPEGRGWYINLLWHNKDKGELPDDLEELATLAIVRFSDFEKFRKSWKNELSIKFPVNENGTRSNPRLDEILMKRQRFIEKRSMAGKIGVLVKAAKEITKDPDEIDYLKEHFEEFEEILDDREKLKQMVKRVLKLYINGNGNKDLNLNKIPFDEFWSLYDKKVGDKLKIQKSWDSLSVKNQERAMNHIPKYKHVQPDKKYRKNPSTYLNNKSWNDELIGGDNTLSVGQKTEQTHEKRRDY
jgi:hypothetical protein